MLARARGKPAFLTPEVGIWFDAPPIARRCLTARSELPRGDGFAMCARRGERAAVPAECQPDDYRSDCGDGEQVRIRNLTVVR